MTTTLQSAVLAFGIGLMALTVPLGAHHAFSAEFDADKPITLVGTVTQIEWINPHSWIHIDVEAPDGTAQRWMIEGGPPGNLLRRGLTRDTVQPGTEVHVDGFQAKDGSLRANGRDITLPDGRKLFMGSSGTGAPLDGRDPTER